MAKAVASETAGQLYKQAIDKAVSEHDIELLVDLIRRPPRSQEIRDHLANVIEGLLSKRKSFPNRKPKQDFEEKRQALAVRVWEVKKRKGMEAPSLSLILLSGKRGARRAVSGQHGVTLDLSCLLPMRFARRAYTPRPRSELERKIATGSCLGV